jgi:hypothetical protein
MLPLCDNSLWTLSDRGFSTKARLCQAVDYGSGRHCFTVTSRKHLKDLDYHSSILFGPTLWVMRILSFCCDRTCVSGWKGPS